MPENEFEKKVSSEMQELKLKPSENVWLAVEERIRKKNKRRVFIILFLLAGIALLGWWQWDNFFGERENGVAKTDTKNIITKETEQTIIKTKDKPVVNQTIEQSKADNKTLIDQQKVQTKPGENPVTESNQVQNEKIIPQKNKISRNIDIKPPTVIKYEPVVPQKKSSEAQNNLVQADTGKVSRKTDTVIMKDPAEIAEVDNAEVKKTDDKPVENKIDSAKIVITEPEVNIIGNDSTVKKEPLRDTLVATIPKNPQTKKWKWGAQFIPGISFLNENGLSFNMNKSASALDYQAPQSGSGAAAPRQKPSDIKPGFAFQLGAFAQRQLSEKTYLSLGLQYGFYSHRIGVGMRRDSLLNYRNLLESLQDANAIYNAGGDTIHYTNRYHFIELPVRFHWQLNKNKTWPITWHAGASFSYLFATNAIMYDTAFNGIYYQNKKMLNRTQFSISTGLSFTIANNRRMRWELGPFADFHLNRLVDNPFEKKKYLFFTGIRTLIIFNSRK